MSTSAPSPALLWAGRILSVLPCLGLIASAGMKLSHSPEIVEGFGNMAIQNPSSCHWGLSS